MSNFNEKMPVPESSDAGTRDYQSTTKTISANGAAREIKIAPDTEAAILFLQRFEPDSPWALTAIQPDRKGIETRTFYPADTDALRAWLARHNGNRNLYFHVNRPLRDLSKKANREDIAEMRWLHVDIDPRAGEPLDAERERALGLLTDRLPEGVPPPTVVIFSGGGYQGFWRLAKPIPVNGDLALADDAARYNQRLEVLFGADNTHNIDRVMRLPGTVNLPDARKVEKGRRPALAEIVADATDWGRVYPIADFAQAPASRADQTATLGRPGQSESVARIGQTAARIEDVNALDQWGVPDRVKVIIVQGRHPDETKAGDDSRSAWLFDAVCGMARAEVPSDVIFSVITDPEFGISESVVDKGRNAEKYAIRQIERAREEIIDPMLRELNERHFVVENDGGKCRVAEWVPDDGDGRDQLSMQSFEDFRNRYMNRQVQVGVTDKGIRIMKPAGKWWLESPLRRQFRGLVFRPGREQVINGYLNLWRGFGIEPVPGDWSRMQAHIRDVLAGGDPASAEYITRWAAWAVQNPDQPAEVALVFKGGQGTGKGTFARAMVELFGQHGLQVTAPGQFAGRFNSHLRDVCLLFADEAVRPDDKTAKGILKALLTERTLPMEGKGKDIVAMTNYAKVIMASNDNFVAPTEMDDRRFAVFKVSDAHKQDRAYFAALNAEMENGGVAAMLHDLLAIDLGDWHPRQDIPDTDERAEQKAAALSGFEAVFLDLLRQGEVPALRWVGHDRPFLATAELQKFAQDRLRREDVSLNNVSDLMLRLGFEKNNNARPRGFVLPPLAEARAAWDRTMAPAPWDDTPEWADMGNTVQAREPF